MAGKILAQGSCTTTSGLTVYTGVTAKTTRFEKVIITNRHTSAVPVTVQVVYAGGSTDATRIVVNQYPVAANDDVYIDEIMSADFDGTFKVIVTAGTANVINYLLTGTEV